MNMGTYSIKTEIYGTEELVKIFEAELCDDVAYIFAKVSSIVNYDLVLRQYSSFSIFVVDTVPRWIFKAKFVVVFHVLFSVRQVQTKDMRFFKCRNVA